MRLESTGVRSVAAKLSRTLPEFRGKRRIIRAFDRSTRTPDPQRFVHGSGARFALGPQLDIIEQELFYCGEYAPEVRSLVRGLLRQHAKPVFWDVGANIGSIGLPLMAEVAALRGYLFEPSPPVLARLAANVRLNPQWSDRLHVYGVPLCDAAGPVAFYGSVEPGNSGVGGLGPSHNRVASPVQLWGMTGDALIAGGLLPPDVIKLDVEGFELEALRGFSALLRAQRPLAIVFEHSAYRFEERRRPKDEVVRFLRAFGFRVLATAQGRIGSEVTASELDGETDFVALRGAPA